MTSLNQEQNIFYGYMLTYKIIFTIIHALYRKRIVKNSEINQVKINQFFKKFRRQLVNIRLG